MNPDTFSLRAAMKTLIFSDTHLTARFNPRKFAFLEKIIDSADRVFINGDLWDYWYCSFDKFVNSEWQRLFPLLKSKQASYLYGNHDPEEKNDERVNYFSDFQGTEIEEKLGSQNLLITHGHNIWAGMQALTALPLSSVYGTSAQFVVDCVEWTGTKLLQRYGKNLLPWRYLDNHNLKRFSLDLPEDKFLVCGHTHLAYYHPEARYVNTGSIRFGHANYVTIEDGNIKLNYARY